MKWSPIAILKTAGTVAAVAASDASRHLAPKATKGTKGVMPPSPDPDECAEIESRAACLGEVDQNGVFPCMWCRESVTNGGCSKYDASSFNGRNCTVTTVDSVVESLTCSNVTDADTGATCVDPTTTCSGEELADFIISSDRSATDEDGKLYLAWINEINAPFNVTIPGGCFCSADVLLQAGGAGGGYFGGGGGAGGNIVRENFVLQAGGTFELKVGSGGQGIKKENGEDGKPTTFRGPLPNPTLELTAGGGGGGGCGFRDDGKPFQPGQPGGNGTDGTEGGGSGGGGGESFGGSGTDGGNDGGSGATRAGGGGGGAGSVGGTATSEDGGGGGNSTVLPSNFSIVKDMLFLTSNKIAGGGGGFGNREGGSGGSGVGGNGGDDSSTACTDAKSNTGSGGGGGYPNSCDGAQGFVVIRVTPCA